ncbi:MAG: DEAD/DEAH box helicase [Clostridia bacterium]|nr:DEAD/DEAH box helicase [Clostridia bacterium]
MKFEDFNLDTHLMMAIYENGYVEPTPIQEKAIPLIVAGNNVVGRSETGSGKTLAYLLPILNKIDLESYGVQALIICPTRELSLQVGEEAKKLARSYDSDIRVVSLNGGMDFDRQRRELKKNAKIIVGTIGRIEEHIIKKSFSLDTIRTLCLDEADEMLTLGFRQDVEYILNRCPKDIQTLLFSATFPQDIKNIIKKFIKEETYVEVGKANTTVENIEQFYIYQKDKVGLLKDLVRTYKDKKILVFANTKSKVEELYNELKKVTKTIFIHGDIMQNERHKAMQEFKHGQTNLMVATDVASRGIDVSDIFLVINFELPMELEYYIHRVGRTARAGKSGTAITLIHNKVSNRKIIELAEILGTPITEMVLSDGKLYKSQNTYVPKDKPEGLWDKKGKKKGKVENSKSLVKKKGLDKKQNTNSNKSSGKNAKNDRQNGKNQKRNQNKNFSDKRQNFGKTQNGRNSRSKGRR